MLCYWIWYKQENPETLWILHIISDYSNTLKKCLWVVMYFKICIYGNAPTSWSKKEGML